MARIFFALAVFAVLLLAANLVIGFTGGDVGGRFQELVEAERDLREPGLSPDEFEQRKETALDAAAAFEPIQQRKQLHFLVGLLASLVTVLVNSIAVTYFIGTTRWCREVCETYDLDSSFVQRSNQLKRKTFPCALAGILIILLIVSVGAMADPIANIEYHAFWVTPHLILALLGTGIIAFAFFIQVGNIGANYEVINEIIQQVNAIRSARGLDDPSEAEGSDNCDDETTEDDHEQSRGARSPI